MYTYSEATVHVELPLGDIVDKVTILLLKKRHLKAEKPLANVIKELQNLQEDYAQVKREHTEALGERDRV